MTISDKTRIKILKAVTLVAAGTTLAVGWSARVMKREGEEAQRNFIFANKIIQRFADLSDEETLAKVKNEFQFDWIVKDLDV